MKSKIFRIPLTRQFAAVFGITCAFGLTSLWVFQRSHPAQENIKTIPFSQSSNNLSQDAKPIPITDDAKDRLNPNSSDDGLQVEALAQNPPSFVAQSNATKLTAADPPGQPMPAQETQDQLPIVPKTEPNALQNQSPIEEPALPFWAILPPTTDQSAETPATLANNSNEQGNDATAAGIPHQPRPRRGLTFEEELYRARYGAAAFMAAEMAAFNGNGP